MSVVATSSRFKDNAHRALGDGQLQKALGNVRHNSIDRRAQAAARLPEFDALRDQARDLRDHVLAHLDIYLDIYTQKVTAAAGHLTFSPISPRRAAPRR